jgi:hypothetical protein
MAPPSLTWFRLAPLPAPLTLQTGPGARLVGTDFFSK